MPRIGEDDLLGGNFGFGVNAQRTWLVVLIVVAFATVKDQIAREENQRNVVGQFRQAGGDLDVQPVRKRRIFLTGRTAAQRGAVNDELRAIFLEAAPDDLGIGKIKQTTT